MAFTVFVSFTECLGWMFMKFTVFLAFVRHLGRSFCGIQRVCSVYGALGLDLCGVYRVSSVYGALGSTCGAFLQHLWHLWGIGIGVVRLALRSCLAFVCFLMLSIGGCLRVWRIGARASPSHEPPSLRACHSARRSLRLGVGAHDWRAWVCQPWGCNSV